MEQLKFKGLECSVFPKLFIYIFISDDDEARDSTEQQLLRSQSMFNPTFYDTDV